MNNIIKYLDKTPSIHVTCYVDDTAKIVGDVILESDVSIWPQAVIRADVNFIRIGKNTNIQDLSILHVGAPRDSNINGSPLIIGENVTVGHNVILHGCQIKNRVLVGMGSIILDNAIIEDDVMIGAGSLVPMNKKLESGYLYLGSPVKKIRPLTKDEIKFLKESAMHYVNVKNNYINS